MRYLSILTMALAMVLESFGATTYPANTNGNNIFFGTNSFVRPIRGDGSMLSNVVSSTLTSGQPIAGQADIQGLMVVGDSNGSANPSNTNNFYRAYAFPNWVSILGGSRVQMVKNAAINGATIEDNYASLDTTISTTPQAKFVMLQGGINNARFGSNVISSVSNMCLCIQRVVDRGLKPIVMVCSPDGSHADWIQTYNSMIKANCEAYNVPFVDHWSLLSEQATNYLSSQYMLDPTSGSIHINQYGAKKAAELVLRTVFGLPTTQYENSANLESSWFSTNNIITNGLYGGTTVPTNWTLSGTSAGGSVSILADTNLPAGNWLVLEQSDTSGSTVLSNNMVATVAANNVMEFASRITLDVYGIGDTNAGVRVAVQFNGGTDSIFCPIGDTTNSIPLGSVFNFIGRVPSSGATSCYVIITMTNLQAKLKLAQTKLINRTTGFITFNTTRNILTPAGNGIQVASAGGTLDGHVGFAASPSASAWINSLSILTRTNIINASGQWEQWNAGGTGIANNENMAATLRYIWKSGNVTNMFIYTNSGLADSRIDLLNANIVLTTNGVQAVGNMSATNGFLMMVKPSFTTNFTCTTNLQTYCCNGTNQVVTLPNAAYVPNVIYRFASTNGYGSFIITNATGAQTIRDGTSLSFAQIGIGSPSFFSDGANWWPAAKTKLIFPNAQFSCSTNIPMTAANTAYPVTFNSIDFNNSQGIALALGTNGTHFSKMWITNSGQYEFTPSLVYTMGPVSHTLRFWFRSNDTNIPSSCTPLKIAGNGTIVATVPFLVNITQPTPIEIWTESDGTGDTLTAAAASGNYPAAPSVICPIKKVSDNWP